MANKVNSIPIYVSEASSVSTMPISNQSFLAWGFAGLGADEQFWTTGFPGDPLNIPRWQWGGKGAPPGLPSFIKPNHNNYVAISSFKRGADGQFHRRKTDFSRMHMVMVDDVGTKVTFEKLALEPSIRVETSPGNFQDWYFLKAPETNAAKADRLIKGMIESGLTADASDPGMRGVTRYGRLPVGINGKAKYVAKLGEPFVQRVTVWNPTLRYSIDEIATAYAVDISSPVNAKSYKGRKRKHNLSKNLAGDVNAEDVFIELLTRADLYLETLSSIAGAHRIVCPWVYEHTDEDPSGTVYFEPSEDNDWHGGFKCHHGHCQGRNIVDMSFFLARLQDLSKD